MAKTKLMPIGNGLDIERAISPAERWRVLDAADTLPIVGGRSKNRHLFRDKDLKTPLIQPNHKQCPIQNLEQEDLRAVFAYVVNLVDEEQVFPIEISV